MDMQKVSTLSTLIDVSISQMMETKHSDFYVETWTGSLSSSTRSMNTTFGRILTQSSFTAPVSQLFTNTVYDSVQVWTILAAFKKPFGHGRTTMSKNRLSTVPTKKVPVTVGGVK